MFRTTLTRFASTVSSTPGVTPTAAASHLPKAAPWQGTPFTAPPGDSTRGELGQVFIPDMERIEAVPEQAIQIVSWSCTAWAGLRGRESGGGRWEG